MYLPTVLNENARLIPLSKDVRKQGLFARVKSNLRSKSREMTKAEEQAQGEIFISKLHESTQTIGIQSFQGVTGGHLLHRKR